LTEAAIDALIEETDAQVNARPRPGWLSADHDEIRRSRRTARQLLRTLPAEVSEWSPDLLATHHLTGGMPGQGKSTAIRAALLGLIDPHGEVA
jgi:hypothetical protein